MISSSIDHILSDWDNAHKNILSRSSFDPLVAEHWLKCERANISPFIKVFPVFKGVSFQEVKAQSIKLYAYANRFMSQLMNHLTNDSIAFALFNSEGCLLRVYGMPSAVEALRLQGIDRLTDWREEQIGANAVSIGLTYNKAVAVCGPQNYGILLADKAVYFAPISLEDRNAVLGRILLGGIAIITPFQNASPDYLLTAFSFANDITLHIFMADNLHEMYMSESNGMLSIDINPKTGKRYILYHNVNLFKILDIPYTNLYFKDVESLFDKPPLNKDFWNIIENRQHVSDQRMVLSCHGREEEYSITVEPYQQKELGILGIRIFISSFHSISSQVSKVLGNNAVVTFSDILGNSESLKNAKQWAQIAAEGDSNVLLLGESGVGKDLFAQAIHNASRRSGRPFIAVNCGALPRDLIVSELFGYDPGSFTGASKKGNIGKFELADSGTLFLDEIAEIPLDMQAMLLRAIEQKKFMRLGSSVTKNVDVKIIAATNMDLLQLVEHKKFRADLYYRLTTLCINIPPLRDRGTDIILLAEHFIKSISQRTQRKKIVSLSSEAKQYLLDYPWYGNVRELQNIIEGIVQFYPGDLIEPKHIIEYLNSSRKIWGQQNGHIPLKEKTAATSVTREQIIDALKECRYHKTRTAEYLGISRRSLYRYMDLYEIST